uniref:Lipase domain-containing protein n=1 Tax=Glossina palpalis gambiensis TaxID=67801 RepID=A0A1B0BCD7_9MUSC
MILRVEMLLLSLRKFIFYLLFVHCSSFLHDWSVLKKTFRLFQQAKLQTSLERAQPNYDIVFKCRSTNNQQVDDETNFDLQLGDLKGFHRLRSHRSVALFLHGWRDEGSKQWVQEMLTTWIHFQPNHYICIVDWGHLSQNDYKAASGSIFEVGLTVAAIVESMEAINPRFSRKNVTIAGFSLGAHAAGFAGSLLNGELEQIIALDPAAPMFTMPTIVAPKYRLDENDAQFVQVLHTSSGTLGTSVKCGHADFYPNGGTVPQPNCQQSSQIPETRNRNPISCSHSTAAVFFKQSMDPTYPFLGTHCDSYTDFVNGLCAHGHLGRFGVHSKQLNHGNFYFITEPEEPYVKPVSIARRRFVTLLRFNKLIS